MLTRILERVVSLLPKKVQPVAKAVVPATAALVLVAANAFVTGSLDVDALKAAAGLVVTALLTYAIPNR